MVGLPPGMIITLSGETSIPVIVSVRRATASRVARMPFAARVAVMAVAQRLDRGFDDMLRCFEIRLADAEIDDVAPLRHQLRGARQHGEGVFLAKTVIGGNGMKHALPRKIEKIRTAVWHSPALFAIQDSLGQAR